MSSPASASSPKRNSDRKNFKVNKKGNRSFYQNPNLEASDWDFDSEEVYESLVTIIPAGNDSCPVPSSSSGRNPNGDGILDLSSRAKKSGTPKRTRSRSDPGAQTGQRPNQPTPKRSSVKPKRGPRTLHGMVPRPVGRGKARKEQKPSKPKCPVLDAVNEAPIDWELLDFLLREEEEHYKCWSVNQAGETLAECGAGMGTSSVCQSQDRQQTLDRLLQMSPHAEIYDVDFLQVENCLCLTCWIEKLASSNLPAKT